MVTPKKKHLIELMIEAGVKWPDGAKYAAQDIDRYFALYKSKPWHENDAMTWISDNSYISGSVKKLPSLCLNWDQTIVTREQYENALAERDGWIQWSGGECPVGDGDRVAVMLRDKSTCNLVASFAMWGHTNDFSDIIAYRVIDQSGKTAVMPSRSNQVHESHDIPAIDAVEWHNPPSIEQLTADYNAKAAEADRLQAAADEARKLANEALVTLQKAGELLGLVISVDTLQKCTEQHQQPVITDWRDLQIGDVILCVSQGNHTLDELDWIVGEECKVVELAEPGKSGKPIKAKFKNGEKWWIGKFRFIRRP